MFVFSLDFPFLKKSVFFWDLKSNPHHSTKPNKMILRNIWAKNFLYRNCFSFCFLVPPIILFFGSGSFYRLLRLPKTQKPGKKTKKKQKKKQRILRNVWGQDFVVWSWLNYSVKLRKWPFTVRMQQQQWTTLCALWCALKQKPPREMKNWQEFFFGWMLHGSTSPLSGRSPFCQLRKDKRCRCNIGIHWI